MADNVGDFYVSTDVDACDCTRGLCGHRGRVCTESWLWKKNPLSSEKPGVTLTRVRVPGAARDFSPTV